MAPRASSKKKGKRASKKKSQAGRSRLKGEQIRKRLAERDTDPELQRLDAERAERADRDETVKAVRAMAEAGQCPFPALPENLYRGVDAEFGEDGVPPHERTRLTNPTFGPQRYWTPVRRAAAANEIAIRMARGESVASILSVNYRDKERLPDQSSFYGWIFGLGDEYVHQVYQLGRKMRSEAWADQMVDIADSVAGETEMAAVQGARLRVETRQRIAEVMQPKVWGKHREASSGVSVYVQTNLGGIDGDDAPEGGHYQARVVARVPAEGEDAPVPSGDEE